VLNLLQCATFKRAYGALAAWKRPQPSKLFYTKGYLTMKNLLFLVVFSLTLTVISPNNVCADYKNSEQYTILSAIDGDTVTVSKGGIVSNYHLIGIDAPEMNQPFGKESYEFLSKIIDEDNYTFEPVKVFDADINFGIIRYTDTSTGVAKDVACELLCQGLAYDVYKYDTAVLVGGKHKPRIDLMSSIKRKGNVNKYQGGENYAVNRRLGVWSRPKRTYPWDFRINHALVEIEFEDYLKSIISLTNMGESGPTTRYVSYQNCYESEKNIYLSKIKSESSMSELDMRLAEYRAKEVCSDYLR